MLLLKTLLLSALTLAIFVDAKATEKPKLEARTKQWMRQFLSRSAKKHGGTYRVEKLRRDRKDGTELQANRRIQDSLFEGDVALTPAQAETLYRDKAPANGLGREGAFNAWGKTIPYSFGFSGDSKRRAAIKAGIGQWEGQTCLRFVERRDKDRLDFAYGSGCWSYVGTVGGAQSVSIGRNCDYPGIVAHEIGHALGFWHEQSRPDRDGFIKVNYANVQSSYRGNFEKHPLSKIDSRGVGYDFGSVMHYSPTAFSSNGRETIEPQSAYQLYAATFGHREAISFADVKQMNLLYCSKECGSGAGPKCANGGYRDPKDCSKCRCPDGFGGRTCEGAEKVGCGGALLATKQWQTIQSREAKCAFVLKAMAGGKVELEFTSMEYSDRRPCKRNYVEVKFRKDMDVTGASLCGTSEESLRSQGPLMALIHRGDGGFKARFRDVGGKSGGGGGGGGGNGNCCAKWSSWSVWRKCSKPCGRCGKQKRTRRCRSPGCPKTQTQKRNCPGMANRRPCPGAKKCCGASRYDPDATFCLRE